MSGRSRKVAPRFHFAPHPPVRGVKSSVTGAATACRRWHVDESRGRGLEQTFPVRMDPNSPLPSPPRRTRSSPGLRSPSTAVNPAVTAPTQDRGVRGGKPSIQGERGRAHSNYLADPTAAKPVLHRFHADAPFQSGHPKRRLSRRKPFCSVRLLRGRFPSIAP
jgi:hypothetical protein